NEFNLFGNAYQNAAGEMFFSSDGGMVRFFPDQVVDSSYIPPVVLTDFRLFGKSMDPGKDSVLKRAIFATPEITLSNRQNIFSVEFSALSYGIPERNRYRYKLEGLENHWTETDSSRRFASYTTLPPATYVLRVQGSNAQGVWNEAGASIRIVILSPF